MSCHECYIRFIIIEPDGEVIKSLILHSLTSQTLTHYVGRESGQTRIAEL